METRRRMVGLLVVASEETTHTEIAEDLPGLPPPATPAPSNNAARRFVCSLPDGTTTVLRLPAERYRDPARRIGAAIMGSLGLTFFWLVIGLVLLLIPIIGMVIGGFMIVATPIAPFVFFHQLMRDYVVACVSCNRRVRVSGMDHTGQGALCQCGARYRHAKLTEWPIEEVNSNV